jgi:hypothetical protein
MNVREAGEDWDDRLISDLFVMVKMSVFTAVVAPIRWMGIVMFLQVLCYLHGHRKEDLPISFEGWIILLRDFP